MEDGTLVSRDYTKTKIYIYAKVHIVKMFMYNIYIISTKTDHNIKPHFYIFFLW